MWSNWNWVHQSNTPDIVTISNHQKLKFSNHWWYKNNKSYKLSEKHPNLVLHKGPLQLQDWNFQIWVLIQIQFPLHQVCDFILWGIGFNIIICRETVCLCLVWIRTQPKCNVKRRIKRLSEGNLRWNLY